MEPLTPPVSQDPYEPIGTAPPPHTSPRTQGGTTPARVWTFWSLLLLALIVRLGYLAEFAQTPFFSQLVLDEANYDAWAQRIAAGDWLGEGPFTMNPLGPYMMALFYKVVGHNLLALRIFQALIDVATCALTYRFSRNLAGERVGLVSLLLMALYGPMVFYSMNLVGEVWCMFFLAASLALLTHHRVSPLKRVPAGALFALACMGRPNMAVMAPLLPFAMSFRIPNLVRKQRGQQMLMWMGGMALVFGPVYARNVLVGGDKVLITAHGGVNLWIGNNPDADGFFKTVKGSGLSGGQETLISSSITVAEKATGRALKPSEASAWWQNRAISYMEENPVEALKLLGQKALYFLNAYEKPLESNYYFLKGESVVLRLLPFGFGLLMPLALLGAWFSRGRMRELAVLHVMNIAYAGTVVLFFISMRYRLPVILGMIPMAAVGIVSIVDRLKLEGKSFLPRLVPAAVAFFVVVNLPIQAANIDHDIAHTHFLLGNMAKERGEMPEALKHYQTAVKLYPEWAPYYNNLALTQASMRLPNETLKTVEQAIALGDPDPRLFRHRARAYLQLGMSQKAIEDYQRTLDAAPGHLRTVIELATLKAKEGDSVGALETLQRARLHLKRPASLEQLDVLESRIRGGAFAPGGVQGGNGAVEVGPFPHDAPSHQGAEPTDEGE